MRAGRMYRIKNLSKNRLNTVMRIATPMVHNGRIAQLETENPQYISRSAKILRDGDLVACLGIMMRETHHYEKQPFYRVLTLTGDIAYVSKGTRNKYFELVKKP